MKRILSSLGLLCCAAALAAGLPNIKPLVDHLRTLPAEVRGEVFVKSRIPILDNNEARVSLRPDRNIYFGFDENEVNVNLTGALNMCVKTFVDLVDGCLQVDVQHVSWTAEKGFEARVQMASYDVFGAYANGTKEALEKTLNERFGEKMKQASAQVKKFRQSKDLGEAQQVAQAIGSVFADGSSAGPAVDFGGRVGLNFHQPVPHPIVGTDHPVQIGDYRVGLKHGDDIDLSASFFKNNDGLHIQRFELTSQEGINLNEGTEYEHDMRIILHRLAIDADGSDISLHLGASETIAGLAAILEVVSQSAGAPPSQTCAMCEFAELPQFTSEADLSMRKAIFDLVRDHHADLLDIGVSAHTLELFYKIETCKINSLTCQLPCHLGDTPQNACMASCLDIYKMCAQAP
jgi:hypothetical protein